MSFDTETLPDEAAVAARAAQDAAGAIAAVLARQPRARVMFATGASQFRLLELLIADPGIAWDRIEMCHLDEYIGLPHDHPASLVHYLEERLIRNVAFHSRLLIDGMADPVAECARLGAAMAGRTVDLALVGIGENGHLAFNDPPADFAATAPYIIVELDDACRRQQVGEGWFRGIDEVPRRAISASIQFILSARRIVACVPGARKARAVKDCLQGAISPAHPASALRRHANAVIYLDRAAAALL